MAIPDYIKTLREKIGNDLVWAIGVTCVVLRPGPDGPQILLQQRRDLGSRNPICGTVDPGEDPDLCAIREVAEETGVQVVIDRLLSTAALPAHTLPNGHQIQYLDLSFAAHPVGSGDEAHIADDESLQVRWCSVDDLPPMPERHLLSIRRALGDDHAVRFGAAGRLLAGDQLGGAR